MKAEALMYLLGRLITTLIGSGVDLIFLKGGHTLPYILAWPLTNPGRVLPFNINK